MKTNHNLVYSQRVANKKGLDLPCGTVSCNRVGASGAHLYHVVSSMPLFIFKAASRVK